jgi:lysozyme
VAAVNRLVGIPLRQNEFDALVSFTFNVGAGPRGLAGSSLLFDVNGGAVPSIGDFTMFSNQKGHYVPGLANRREAEYQLYIGDRYLYSQ